MCRKGASHAQRTPGWCDKQGSRPLHLLTTPARSPRSPRWRKGCSRPPVLGSAPLPPGAQRRTSADGPFHSFTPTTRRVAMRGAGSNEEAPSPEAQHDVPHGRSQDTARVLCRLALPPPPRPPARRPEEAALPLLTARSMGSRLFSLCSQKGRAESLR